MDASRAVRRRILEVVIFCFAWMTNIFVWAKASKIAYSQDAQHAFLPPTAFAPGGRLTSVELAAQAGLLDSPSNNLVAAVLCQEGVVVVATLPESPYLPRRYVATTSGNNTNVTLALAPLLVPETFGVARAPFLRLSTNMWAVTAGNHIDSQLLRLKLHRVAESMREEDQGDRPDILARKLADNMQILTQELGHGRILAACAVIFTNGEIWRVDPTGQFWKCQGTVVGRNCFAAESKMLNNLRGGRAACKEKIAAMSKDEAMELCKNCIPQTFSQSTHAHNGAHESMPCPVTRKGLWVSKRQYTWYSESDLQNLQLQKKYDHIPPSTGKAVDSSS